MRNVIVARIALQMEIKLRDTIVFQIIYYFTVFFAFYEPLSTRTSHEDPPSGKFESIKFNFRSILEISVHFGNSW